MQLVLPHYPTSPPFRVRSSFLLDALSRYLLPAVIHAHSQMTTAVKNGFEGKRFPSVRRISLPCSAHEIIKSCPNVEEVICTEGNGSTIIGSIIKGNCQQVRILKGISAPITRTLHRYQRMSECKADFVDRIGQGASQLEAYQCGDGGELFSALGCTVY